LVSGDIKDARAIAIAIGVETASIAATLASAHEPFRRRSPAKWSAAEQVEHLRLSVRPLTLSFLIPRFVLGIFGTARPPGRTCDEVVADYQGRLARGAKASGPFIPARLTGDEDLPRLLTAFQQGYAAYAAKLAAAEDASLDSSRLPHPILGRLSIREMAFFTLYHLGHHHALIRREVQSS
jgi:hypothetical protein